MPTNFDLIRKRNNIPVKETEKTNTISTQKEGPEITLVPKNKDGGIDWNAIRERNGMGETYSISTEEERIQEKLDRVLSKDRQTNTPSLLEQTEGLSDYIQDFTQMRKEETGKEFGSVETYEPVSRQTPVGRLKNNMEENESQDAFSFTQPVQAFESVYTQQEAEQAIKNLSNINTLYEQIRQNTIEGGAYVPTTGSYSLTDEQRKEIEKATKELESIISSNTSSAIEKEAAQQYVNLFEEITGKGNYAKLALSQFAQGVPSTIRNTATGISNMIGDIASGGRLSESKKKLDKYFSENPNLLQEIAQGKPVYTPAIAEETGVRQNDLDQYLATAQDRAMQERNYAEYGQNLNQGRAEFIGSNAYSLGAQIPGLLLTSGANSVSPMWKKTVEQAKELGYLIDAKTGNVLKNLKDVTGGLLGNLADGKSLKTALKSAFQGNFATYLIGVSASGGQYNELMRTEDYDVRNFLNAFGQGFAEYFTEGLFGFSDMASFERFFDSSIGSGTTRFLKGLLNWLSGGGEEGLEEIVNAPLGELINFATGKKEDMKDAVMSWNPEFSTGGFQGIRAIIGENRIFNLEDMMVGGLGGFVTGAILGMAGSVASTYDSMKEGKDISKTVKTLNRFAQEELPNVFRPQMLDPNTASRKDVAAYTVQIQNAIADYAGELKNQMEAAEMQAEADARRSVESSAAQAVLENNAENIPGMLPTAAQAEERARLRQDATELERSGIAAGVSDEDMQTARRLSNVLGREIRFYDGNNREGTEAVANGYYDRNTIYVNSRSRNPVAQIISHELTHSLESAKAYGELSNMILGELERTGEDLSRMRAEKKNLYARNGVMLSNENANREIVAEYVEKNLLSNETKILELTRKNRTLAQRISGWIQSTLAKLGNKKSQERAFLERANRLYAKALRQTQNETGQRMPQEAQSTMQNRAQESTAAQLTEVQKYREPSRDAEQTVRRTEEPERYETRNAAPTERVNPEGMRELQEAYAAGQITDEEFDDAIDALMEEEGLLDRDMLDAQYSISYDKDNRPFVIVENDILDGVPESEWVRTVKNNLREKFPDGVRVGNNEIKINKQSRQEMTFSRYMQRLFNTEPDLYADKLRATANADEILKASRNWVNEALLHPRNDAMIDFARGEVLIRVGDSDYTAEVIVGNQGSRGLLLYDVLNIKRTTIQEQKNSAGTEYTANAQKELRSRGPVPASNTTIPQQSTGVNPSIRESVETDTSGGIMLPTASEADRQYSISEADTEDAYIDDASYQDAVQANDSAMQQRLVQAAAEYAMPKSRVRDQDGNLLKVYHGTKSFGFTVFDRNRTVFEGPFYFTSDAETARSYSGERGIRAVSYPGGADMDRGSGNYAVYLNLQNPLEVNCRGGDWDAIPASRRLIEAYLSAFPDEHRGKTLDSPSVARYAEYAGYDGVILRNIQDNGGSIRYDAISDVYIAFSTDQIKSADTVTYDDTGKVIPLSERFQMDHDDIRYSISEDFADELEEWYYETDPRDRITDGGYLRIGTVSEPLKSIGVRDGNVYWRKSKIGTIMQDHPEIDLETAKNVPQILENPVVILKSRTQDNSITLFGDVTAANGERVMAALHLVPRASGNMETEFTLLASAYGRSEGNIRNLLKNSEVLYLDPNKNRTNTWLMSLGVQFPSDQPAYGPIGTITYHDGEVKISGVPYDQYMQEDGEKYTPQYSVDENDENERATGYDDRGERWDGTMMEIGKDQTEREAEEARRIQNAEYQNYPWLYGTGETVSEAIQEGERTQTPGMLPKAEADPVENLPAKAKRYFTRAERYLIDKMARVLNVPNLAGRESFQTVVREIADEYLQNGTVSGETIARVFNQAYEDSVALNRAYYEEYRELREYFKTLNLTITKEQANDIPDQDAFLQSNRNRIGIRMGEDSNVNEAYAELQRQWPALFQRGSELTEAEKAQKIASVAQSFEMAKRSLNGYYGKNPNEARRWARRDFEAAVQDATGEFQVVRRYMEDRNAEKQEIQIPTTQEEVARLWVLAKTARKNYEKVLARNLLTEHDEIQVGRLLRGEIEPQHLNETEDNVQGITEVYQAKREYEDIAKVIRAWNQARKAALKQQADGYLETANDWKDKQAGILYARETMERNIRDIVPDEDLADEIIRRYFTPVHDAAAQANRMKNQYRERVKALDLSRDIAEGNLVSEAHAVQLLGEAEDNIRMMTQSRGLIRERDGKTLEEWRGVVKKLWEENPNLDAGKIRSAVEDFRKIYDELFQMMNETRIRNGYEPVNYRNGYFPHFQPGDGDGILARFGKAMGVTTDVTALPTTINGLTHTFRPGIQWFGNAQERLGFNTVYDAVEGFDKYIEGVSDVIFQTDNIQRLRALATQIRYRTGDEGIRKQIDDVLTNPNLTEEEKQDRISRIYESGRYALSNFVAELDEYTNLLANKKSRSDRGMERAIGRRAYNVMKALEQRLGANMVAINPGSWLTNFIPLVQGNAMLDRGMLLRGMWDTLKAYRSDDGIVNQSSFLTNRRGSDPIVKSYEQGERAAGGAKKVGQTIGKAFGKSGEILASPMEFIDYFVADSLVRARYRQNLGKGMSEDAAMEDADAFAAGVMADRSKGAMPTLFYSRNPMVKLFTQFQLEVNNQISYILKDIPREKRKNAGRSITAMLLKFFLGSWLFNEIFEFTIGRRPTLDPIGILNDTAGDLTGWELPNLVELGLGAVSGNMPSFQTEQVGLYDAGINMFENAAEQMPFIGGLLGGGRLPISSAIPDFATAWNALTNDEWSSEKRWQEIRDEVLEKPVTYLALPFGGGQLKKIYEGIEGILEGGSYVVNAEGERQLQYPIYADTTGEAIGNAVRATLFGRTSLPTGQEWIESGFGMLSADQTAVYEGMLEAGISGREAYELIESMRQAEKTDTESKADQQRRILEESGISGEGKSIAYYGMLASDRERELMTSLNDDFTDMGEVTDVLLAIKDAGNLTGAAASNAKRDAILESGLSESDKKEIYRYTFGERQENGTYMSSRDEDIQAFENAGLSFDEFLEAQNEYSTINEQYDRAGDKALEFSRWVDEQPYADKQKDVIKESFRYFSQVPTDAGRYETFQEAGLSTESAYELTEILNGLEPEEGKEQVSNYQRYTAILESSLGEREKLDAIGAIMGTEMETESGNPTQYARLLSAMDEGVDLKDWFGVTQYKSEAKTDYDEYGEEVKSAKEKVVEYIDSLNISEEEKDALYLYGCNYAESGLSDTPWQSGGWSMSDIDWSGIILPMA